MRNLKKSLALILALVMVLGLCAINSGAVFGDEDAIDEEYSPAVDMMAGMGILKGDDNDNDGVYDFRPTDPVTRAEAAKMITYMILGEATAEKLPARDVLDVPASNWASKYISYLYNKGIINGMGDGTFAASANVTALQYAKMLLCACGYGAKKEYVGTGWDVNVFIDAIDSDKGNIFGDADVADFAAPATREEAAYYTYNALTKTTLVSYSDGKYSKQYNSDKTEKRFSAKYGYKTVKGIVTATVDTDSKGIARVGTDKFDTDVITMDMIGHKISVTFNEGKKNDDGVYTEVFSAEDLSTEISVDTTVKDLQKALGGSSIVYASTYVYWNNYAPDGSNLGKDVVWSSFSASKTAYDQVDGMDAGCAYILDDEDEVIGFKSFSFEVAKITAIRTTAEEETISFAAYGATGSKSLSNTATSKEFSVYEGAEKGDIAKLVKIGDVYSLQKLDMVEGVTVTAYNKIKGLINTTYAKSKSVTGNMVAPLDSSGDKKNVIKEAVYDLYLDDNGDWVYAVQQSEPIKEFIYVTAYYTSDDVKYVQGVNAEGEIKSYKVNDDSYTFVRNEYAVVKTNRPEDGTTGKFNGAGGLVVSVMEGTDGVYKLKKYTVAGKQLYMMSVAARFDTAYNGSGYGEYPSGMLALSRTNPFLDNSDHDGTKISVGTYYIDNDTKVYRVYSDGTKSKSTTVAALSDRTAINNAVYPITYITSLENEKAKAYHIDVMYLQGKLQPKSSGAKFLFSLGTEDYVDSDYWSYVLNEDGNYVDVSCFLMGEWTDLTFDMTYANTRACFEEQTIGGNKTLVLKPGFYTYTARDNDTYTLDDNKNSVKTKTVGDITFKTGATGNAYGLEHIKVDYFYRDVIYCDASQYSHIIDGEEKNSTYSSLPAYISVDPADQSNEIFYDLTGHDIKSYADLETLVEANEEVEVYISMAASSGTVYSGKAFIVEIKGLSE